MKPQKPTLMLLALCFLLCAGMKCKKEVTIYVPKLPAETQTGAKTFGCLVDGKIYVPQGGSSPSRHAISTSIQFAILNLKTDNGVDGINLSTAYLNDIGDYDLALNSSHANYTIGSNNYICTQGTLTITRYDKVNRIISGRFFFTAKDDATGKTVNITDGRFDVTFTN